MQKIDFFESKSKINSNLAIQLYGLYLLTSIVAPAVLLNIFGYWPEFYLNVTIDPLRLIYIIFLLFLPFLLHVVIGNSSAHIRKSYNSVFVKILIIAMILIAVFSIISGNSRWRYSELLVSEIGGIWLYFFIIMPALGKIIALDILFLRHATQPSFSTKILLIIMLILTINGNMTAIFTLIIIFLLLTRANRLLFDEGRNKTGLVRFFFYFAAFTVSLVLVVIGYIYGESVKRGISSYDVYYWIIDNLSEQADWIKDLILGRISPTYVSILHISKENWCNYTPCSDFNFFSLLHTGLFRILNVLGLNEIFNITKDLNGTISRINYNEINIYPFNDREGTSPGLLPGFFYAFGSYLAGPVFLVYATFLILIFKKISSLIKHKLSLPGKLLLLYFLLPLFESPVDFFLIIDDGVIYLVGLLIITWIRTSVIPNSLQQKMMPLKGAIYPKHVNG
jgi:hypothetical protein